MSCILSNSFIELTLEKFASFRRKVCIWSVINDTTSVNDQSSQDQVDDQDIEDDQDPFLPAEAPPTEKEDPSEEPMSYDWPVIRAEHDDFHARQPYNWPQLTAGQNLADPLQDNEYKAEEAEIFRRMDSDLAYTYLRGEIARKPGREPLRDVPYFINPSLDSIKQQIKAAMKEIEDNSRFKFREMNTWGPEILYITSGDGCSYSCYNFVAKPTDCQPIVTLGEGCHNHGTILHELLHSIGFKHEHQRPDRDEYIEVFLENIKKGKEIQFKKLESSEYKWSGFKFDFDSIMMYDEKAFSKNDSKTIEAKDGRAILRNTSLSPMDIIKLRNM